MAITLEELERRVVEVEKCNNKLQDGINQLIGKSQTVEMILKWVVLPLLAIVAALAGVSLTLPQG